MARKKPRRRRPSAPPPQPAPRPSPDTSKLRYLTMINNMPDGYAGIVTDGPELEPTLFGIHLGKQIGRVEEQQARRQKQYPGNKVRARQEVMRNLIASHPDMTPRQILEFLLEHHPALASIGHRAISTKTIINQVAAMLREQRPSARN